MSWRVIALITTMSVTWLLTGSLDWAMKIGFLDTAIKIVAYYAHERMWVKISYGRPTPSVQDWQI